MPGSVTFTRGQPRQWGVRVYMGDGGLVRRHPVLILLSLARLSRPRGPPARTSRS